MKKCITYPEIEQFRHIVASVHRQSNFVGLDDSGEAIYDESREKPILKFRGTVKIHGCFDGDTLITLANGEEVPISEIQIGDIILSYDINHNFFIEKEVECTENSTSDKEWIKLTFDNNSFIECTIDHKFFTTNRGWVMAGELNERDVFIENR